MLCMVLSKFNIAKQFFFQSDVVFIKFQTFQIAFVWKGCFIVHLFGNAPMCASTVLECSCCRIHRYGRIKIGNIVTLSEQVTHNFLLNIQYQLITRIWSFVIQYQQITHICSFVIQYQQITHICSFVIQYQQITHICSFVIQYQEIKKSHTCSLLIQSHQTRHNFSLIIQYQEITHNVSIIIQY